AVPSSYTVRFHAGGRTLTHPLVIKADPRVAADGVTPADLQEQLAHNLRARDLVSEVNLLVARVAHAKRRLRNATGAAADTLQYLTAVEKKLVTPPIRYSKPELQAQIQYLYNVAMGADQKVGRDAVERYDVLRRELDVVTGEARGLLGDRAAETRAGRGSR
ncbi:MAG: hypothetical protein HY560_03720, partial [Gemmatimonadetes bacterium]|nr:hypothetical protein [Gemmatimonadota bacterium]